MSEKKYVVKLDDSERQQLEELLRGGQHRARKLACARILLKAADGCTDERIVAAVSVGRATVERTRESFVERGLEALNERPRPGKKRTLDAKAEARLIAEACSDAPAGQTRWTMQLLADRLVELKIVQSVSDETIRRALKKTSSSRG